MVPCITGVNDACAPSTVVAFVETAICAVPFPIALFAPSVMLDTLFGAALHCASIPYSVFPASVSSNRYSC